MATSPDAATRLRLEKQFPLLAATKYAMRTGPDVRFNCIAWAMGSTTEWWWPAGRYFWPVEGGKATPEGFAQAFATAGFEACLNGELEEGFEKIALYVMNGRPTHSARIENALKWSSKLGSEGIIEHEPGALNGVIYGEPVYFFRRKV